MADTQKRGRGRPAGALNSLLMNKTRIYQEQVSEEDIKEAYRFIVSVMKDDEEDKKLRMEAFDRFMKYACYTPQIIATADLTSDLMEAKAPSAEALTKAAQLIDALKAS